MLCGTGSLASINLPGCVSELQEYCAFPVHVVVTENALRFTTIRALQAMAAGRVWADDFSDPTEDGSPPHVLLTDQAALIVVYPATANFIAKIAHGLADDLPTTVILSAACPVIVVPAMHWRMWDNAATQANLHVIDERGLTVLWPASGETREGSGVSFPVAEVVRRARSLLRESPTVGVLTAAAT